MLAGLIKILKVLKFYSRVFFSQARAHRCLLSIKDSERSFPLENFQEAYIKVYIVLCDLTLDFVKKDVN